ncbi:MAG: hypothetical protein R3A10_14375 [Caldilineaceae bacterium]
MQPVSAAPCARWDRWRCFTYVAGAGLAATARYPLALVQTLLLYAGLMLLGVVAQPTLPALDSRAGRAGGGSGAPTAGRHDRAHRRAVDRAFGARVLWWQGVQAAARPRTT